jgi:hypothetical protein
MYADVWKCILVRLPTKEMFRMGVVSKQLNTILAMPQWSHQYQSITGRKFNWLMFMLMKYPNADWSPRKLSMNSSADIRYLCETGIIDWDALYDNKQLVTSSELRQYVTSLIPSVPSCYAESFRSRFAKWSEIVADPQYDWNWYTVSCNANITMQIVNDNPDTEWNFNALSSNSAITWDDVVNNPDLPWDCGNLSLKPNPNWDYLIENCDDTWDWYTLSQVAPFEVVLANPNLNWYWDGLSKNPSVSFETILAHPREEGGSSDDGSDYDDSSDGNTTLKYRWEPEQVSLNPSVNIDIIKNNPDYPWNWENLSSNPSMTPEIVDANPSLPWDWRGMSYNKSLTWEYVYKNIDRNWDWDGLSDME